MHPIESLIEQADQAIVAEDFDRLMEFYTDDAILVIEPGRNVVGKASIKQAFVRIAEYFKHGLQVEQAGMEILESGDTALVLAHTVVAAPGSPPVVRKATYVYRRLDGKWLCAIDNSYGHEIIGATI